MAQQQTEAENSLPNGGSPEEKSPATVGVYDRPEPQPKTLPAWIYVIVGILIVAGIVMAIRMF